MKKNLKLRVEKKPCGRRFRFIIFDGSRPIDWSEYLYSEKMALKYGQEKLLSYQNR